MTPRLVLGDCIEAMREMPAASIDAVVTDPPYGLGFMGKDWDHFDSRNFTQDELKKRGATEGIDHTKSRLRSASMHAGEYDYGRNHEFQAWVTLWAVEVLRVLKPGGHLLAFGGTRTYHRLACAIEDAGFEVRDSIIWLYGSGFPKSLDVSKAIDKAAGAERAVIGPNRHDANRNGTDFGRMNDDGWQPGQRVDTAPATEDARTWEGWGTALKPGHEPIVVSRKPLSGTVVANVLEWGCGAINIDGCRIEGGEGGTRDGEASPDRRYQEEGAVPFAMTPGPRGGDARGRWPANVILDEERAAELDEQSGERASDRVRVLRRGATTGKGMGYSGSSPQDAIGATYGDTGGASRFFYVAKTSRVERSLGLEGFDKKPINWSSGEQNPGSFQADGTDRAAKNNHPTVKPVALMRHLVRLVTPPGGTVLDPFMGSGTTGIAASIEGFDFIGVEREADYMVIAEARIKAWPKYAAGRPAAPKPKDRGPQTSLFDEAAS